jgi:DNA-directed RNA polymerase specialized sigma24 family protein
MINKIDNHIYIHQDTIERLTKIKEQIRKNIEKMDGLDKKVAYKRDIEGKSLLEIADELGYSYDYIKNVSSRCKCYNDVTDKPF